MKPVGDSANTGYGPTLQTVDIGHPDYLAVVEPDSAFWTLVRNDELGRFLRGKSPEMKRFLKKRKAFLDEMETIRFKLTPSAVYFNPTERCNLNCKYCYIPDEMRRNGPHMSEKELVSALSILKSHFRKTVKGRKPQIVFHGSEPLMNKEAVFAGISRFRDDFDFGVQTNATLLDDEAIAFLKDNDVGIGISVDGPDVKTGDANRRDWNGKGSFAKAVDAMRKLADYKAFTVICTVTSSNMAGLSKTVDFFHENGVSTCMLNIVRCTQPGARTVKPDDSEAVMHFMKALDRTYELYKKTGRRLVVANFANIMLAILAPSARKLMCDISPCGGGRCFFAVAADGRCFPCSEFVGLPEFCGGNIFKDDIGGILGSEPFKQVTGRLVENIHPCRNCAIRHFCGSPCPAEAFNMNGGQNRIGAFCRFYEEQVRYALRLVADDKHEAFLPEKWDRDLVTVF